MDHSKEIDDFFIVLPSNTKTAVSNGFNTMSDYTISLPRNLSFHGDWYVGLTEITYTKSWVRMIATQTLGLKRKGSCYDTKILIPGNQTSVSGLVGWINTTLQEVWTKDSKFIEETDVKGNRPFLMFGENQPFVCVTPGIVKSTVTDKTTHFWPDVGEDISRILGLSSPLHRHPDDIVTQKLVCGFKKPDLSAGIDALFVYSDIVTPTIVGDRAANILRVVPVTRATPFGENVDVIFPHPYYYRVSKREFGHITVNIRDETGSPVPFEFGRVIITLHFKKWKNTM